LLNGASDREVHALLKRDFFKKADATPLRTVAGSGKQRKCLPDFASPPQARSARWDYCSPRVVGFVRIDVLAAAISPELVPKEAPPRGHCGGPLATDRFNNAVGIAHKKRAKEHAKGLPFIQQPG
jgi:hypothetical protein